MGLALPQFGPWTDPTRIGEFAAAAEDLGYVSLWVGDRLITPLAPSDPYPSPDQQPYPSEFVYTLDPLLVLAQAAAATTTVRFNASTLNAPFYNGVVLGRSLTSLDVMSGGRLDVGLGIGWMRDEYTSAGVDWDTRGRRLDEMLDLWRAMWNDDPASFHGEHFELTESVFGLRPVQVGGPPLWFGGLSAPALRRVGRRGAGWLPVAGLPSAFEQQLWDVARTAAEEAGRDPGSLRRAYRVNPYAGSGVDDMAAAVSAIDEEDECFVDLTYTARSVDHGLDMAAELIRKV